MPLKIKSSISAEFSPPLKWAGGKRWLLPILRQVFKDYHKARLVEPFAGGLAVALGLNPDSALLNDRNVHLINFYQWLQQGLSLERELKNDAEFFYQQRLLFNQLVLEGQEKSKIAAELFYYLNRTAFNGLCRFNSKGAFNVPFGSYKKINYRADFLDYQAVFKKWKFSCLDFEELHLLDTDFLYVDPPYDVEFTRYSKDDFTWQDQARLVAWLGKQKCPIVASNQATSRILDLYQDAGFQVTTLAAPRRIAANGNRSAAQEMLAFKNFPSTVQCDIAQRA